MSILENEKTTHVYRGFEDLPDLAWKLTLYKCEIIPAVIQAAGKLSINVLRGSSLWTDETRRRKVPYDLIVI